jgi:phosphoribosylaminoimidazole carboxylase/phosphoribosylaminoimidazole-succinocarboxamide synthase
MADYKKGKTIAEGKTKRLHEAEGTNNLMIVESKADITKFDDASLTKSFEKKAEYATTTTCRVFELLQKAGIPVAYREQISPTEFVVEKCDMVSLEVVARRYAVGSFLKRHPELKMPEGDQPHRFHRLIAEFFLKTTDGKVMTIDGKEIDLELDAKKGEEDPFIVNPCEEEWDLYHPKKPEWIDDSALNKKVLRDNIIRDKEDLNKMEEMLRRVFLVLEGMWSSYGLRFIDMKIEFGYNSNGELMVADVIDNDSWRLRDAKWQELSKEAFRQDEALDEVERKYGTVADLIDSYRRPKQALVLWRGSDKDEFPPIDEKLMLDANADIVEVTMSAHKSPLRALLEFEQILGEYPDGGVVIAKVGRSNGLGPILAARTSWQVIAIPATAAKSPEDVWSSIRMPSMVPLATIWPDANAVLAAANILGRKDPVIYQTRQYQIEQFDD